MAKSPKGMAAPKKKPRKPKVFNPKAIAFQSMRRAFSRCSLAITARDKALAKKKGPRGGKRYICSECGLDHGAGMIEIDHIEEVVPFYLSLEVMPLQMVFERIFCSVDNLQILCKACHSIKTKTGTAERKIMRTKKKYLVCRLREGGLIKVIPIVDLKLFEVNRWDILDVFLTRVEADSDMKRRKKLK